MNTTKKLTVLHNKFASRVGKYYIQSLGDPRILEKYSMFCIYQLNNFLRAYLFSINGIAYTKTNTRVSLATIHTYDSLVDECIRYGNAGKYRKNKMGTWTHADEPAYHCPRVFLKIITSLGSTNIGDITTALNDSWKIDVLRSIRNYYAHRSKGTEEEAINSVNARYSIISDRANTLLLKHDSVIAKKVIEDINDYIITFSYDIT